MMTLPSPNPMHDPQRLRSWILGTLLLLVPLTAAAAKPRPIDCDKARSIQPGMTEKQVLRAMGKPYIIQIGRGSLSYGWVAPESADRIDIQFVATAQAPKDRRVLAVTGTCAGQTIGQSTPGDRPAALLAAITQLPHGRELPRHLVFGGTDFHLAYVAENHDTQTRFVEYIPAGQTLSRWQEMVAVFAHSDGSSPTQKMQEMKDLAKQTGNPHFQQIHLAADGSEAIAALPILRDDSVEYQVTRWTSTDKGVQATVYFIRSYQDDGLDRDSFVAREAQRANDYSKMLKALPQIIPPGFGRNAAMTLSTTGKESDPVWVSPSPLMPTQDD